MVILETRNYICIEKYDPEFGFKLVNVGDIVTISLLASGLCEITLGSEMRGTIHLIQLDQYFKPNFLTVVK